MAQGRDDKPSPLEVNCCIRVRNVSVQIRQVYVT